MKGVAKPKNMAAKRMGMTKKMPRKTAKDDGAAKGRKGMMKRLAGAEL